ncbi:hypothetical protein GCM10009624_24250 [Gordonia sinesedis]
MTDSTTRRTRAQHALCLLLTVLGAFQAGLALGCPWGAASYGGAHRGALPPRLRAVSGTASAVYLGTAAYLSSGAGPATVRRRVLSVIAALMAAGTPANLASRSPYERLWAPVTAVAALMAWWARPAATPPLHGTVPTSR